MVNLNLLVVIPHQCPRMKVLITHRYANWTGVHSSPEPRSVCTPNHVPKSLASAKVSNFKMFQTHIQFANPCLLLLPFPCLSHPYLLLRLRWYVDRLLLLLCWGWCLVSGLRGLIRVLLLLLLLHKRTRRLQRPWRFVLGPNTGRRRSRGQLRW